ncbi:MAG TPA: primosomal protein N', partial [Rhodocyclaceae bacterium]|nr:primosomal protein N' [Rhodocyclaceae bacterium]
MPIARVALDVPLPELVEYLAGEATAEDVGRLVRVSFARRERTGVLVALEPEGRVAPEKLKPLLAVRRDLPRLPPSWFALMEFSSRYYQRALGETICLALPPCRRPGGAAVGAAGDPRLRASPAGEAAVGTLPARSVARRILEAAAREEAPRRSNLRRISDRAGPALERLLELGWLAELEEDPAESAAGPPLLEEQSAALAGVSARFGEFAPFLLHGVTGSGKTEVYLRLAQAALARRRQVLLLVPEIALTPQLEGRVRDRFPRARVVALHSELAAGARSGSFVAALTGAADIVLGTRLAVFAPLPRLGLIVVDEEHDPSFKQQDGMRYSARDLAVYRARLESVPVLLGSATPSLESWHHAQQGRYGMLRLTRRAAAEAVPAVRCIDVRDRKLDQGIAPELFEAIRSRLERREQSLVFLNRRGYAPVLACPACGWVSRCTHCSANQVVHLADARLRCHHCGAESGIPRSCPTCGNQDLHPFGRGTQRLESVLAERFPDARILRVDRDSAGSRARWAALLERIHAGDADILIGTQMLAKGHDFPLLTLVGVLNADASLFAADFRAPERLFAQLMQVGGRSGRAGLPGEVLVQTAYPEHPLYRALAAHDFERFAQSQLEERRQAGFPPYAFQALLTADAPVLADALEFLARAREAAVDAAGAGVSLYDPVPMRLARRADRERAQLLVESASRPALQAFLQ